MREGNKKTKNKYILWDTQNYESGIKKERRKDEIVH